MFTMNGLLSVISSARSLSVLGTDLRARISAFDMIFIAYSCRVFLCSTRQTLPNPPLPIGCLRLKKARLRAWSAWLKGSGVGALLTILLLTRTRGWPCSMGFYLGFWQVFWCVGWRLGSLLARVC